MANFLGSVFEFLFKYRPVTFSRGEFAFGSPYPALLILVLALVATGLAVLTYRRVGARSNIKDRVLLTGLRVGALVILMVCLLRPMLVLSMALPQQNFIGVLIDDSQSMTIADDRGEKRSEIAQRLFSQDNARLLKELEEKFLVRFFSFSAAASRIGTPEELTFQGGQTKVLDAVDRAQQDLSAVPVAGYVVVTDGADNSQTAPSTQLLKLKARGVPVYTIGVGREKVEKDIEISRVEAPATALKGASIIVDLLVTQHGYRDKIQLYVEDQGRIVSTQEVTLAAAGEAAPVRVHVVANDAGPRHLKFRLAAQDGELLTQNNEREALVVVSDRREKVLYFEGEPRWEVPFLLRALEEDKNLQIVLLQRTADNKYLRRNVDDGDELAGGFPTTREELFKYRAIILGSVEASFFTHDQLQMLADFVSDRGGSLLLLGGRQSFSEGGFYGTPLADALPVTFANRRASDRGEDDGYFAELSVRLTPAGLIHPVTRLAPDEKESAEKWAKLPPVSTVNRLDELKPGATELITGSPVRGRGSHPVLVYQRYGRGKVLAMPVQDTWMWQMHADIEVDDETHETLWKQVARWLVTGVPRPVNVATANDVVSPNEGVMLRAEVSDARYVPINDAKVKAYVRGPGTPETEIPMEWTVDRDGEYRASFTPTMEGEFRVRAVAYKGDSLISSDTTFFRSAQVNSEYYGIAMNAALLKRIAQETGGKFYTPDKTRGLAEDMTFTKSGHVQVQQLDLWDMPVIFVLLMGLMGSEWIYRKLRGLA